MLLSLNFEMATQVQILNEFFLALHKVLILITIKKEGTILIKNIALN